MDKKKKKYIVLTIIAVLLIGLLILINVIGAGTKSASAESTDTTVTEEYTDITQFAPSGYSKYLIYPASDESTNSGYKIVWFSGSVEPGFLNNYPQIINNDTLHLSCAWPIIGALGDQDGFTNWLMTTLDPNNMVETDGYINGIIYPNCAIKSTIYRSGTDLLWVSNDIYTSIDSLITSLINKKVRYVSAGHIISDITITMTDDGIYSDQDIYSNYEEISLAQIVPLLDNLYAVSNIPKDISQRVIDEANKLIKAKEDGYIEGKEDGYTEGYDEGTNQSLYGIFAGATVASAVADADNWAMPAPELSFISQGFNLKSIVSAMDKHFYDNGIDNQQFRVTINVVPFVWEINSIYCLQSMGFSYGTLIAEDDKRYGIEIDTDNRDQNGYPIKLQNAQEISSPIKQIEINCANVDYTPTIIDPVGGIYQTGFDDGYNSGYDKGHGTGSHEGYLQGQQLGYDQGYKAGLAVNADSLTGWNLISSGLSSIFTALDINIFGFFSIADILAVVMVVSIVFFLFKLIRG